MFAGLTAAVALRPTSFGSDSWNTFFHAEPTIVARFGAHPACAEVDADARSVMQSALTRLARRRRLPIIG